MVANLRRCNSCTPMFVSRPFHRVFSLFTLAVLLGVSPAAEVPVGLKPYADRFDQDCAALDAARDSQLKIPRDRYRAALGAAQKSAAAAGKTNVLNAVTAEIEALSAGSLPEMFPADLPHQLAQDRRAYIAAVANVARALPPRQRDVATKYLRVLAALEASALKSMDAAMAEAVSSEKLRAAALINVASGRSSHSAVANGDFSEGDSGALPAGWKGEGGDVEVTDAAVVTDGMERFLRFQRKFVQRRADLVQAKEIAVPDKAKQMEYSVRIRVKGLAGEQGKNMYPGVHFIARDANEQEVCNTWASTKQDTSWRKLTGRLELPASVKTLRVVVGPFGSVGTIDFDDLEVVFR